MSCGSSMFQRSIMGSCVFLYTIFLKLYIFKSRSHALCTSVCRLYDTEFILDTNAIGCYHKFDHQPRRGKPRRESRVDREERLVFVRRLPANRPFTGGFLMSGFFAWARYHFLSGCSPFAEKSRKFAFFGHRRSDFAEDPGLTSRHRSAILIEPSPP